MPEIAFETLASRRDNRPIALMTVAPDAAPKAVLQMAHGMAEHKERYESLCRYLAGRGYVCAMNDHRGHGRLAMDRGELGDFGRDGARALVDDMHQITLLLRERYPGVPLYLYGHSMGSLAARAYRLYYEADIDGLIVCGSP